MKIYLATQLKPDTTQWKTLENMREREGNIKVLLAFYHIAGGILNSEDLLGNNYSRK